MKDRDAPGCSTKRMITKRSVKQLEDELSINCNVKCVFQPTTSNDDEVLLNSIVHQYLKTVSDNLAKEFKDEHSNSVDLNDNRRN